MKDHVQFTFPKPPKEWGPPLLTPAGEDQLGKVARWQLGVTVVLVSLDKSGGVEWHLSCSYAGKPPSDAWLAAIRKEFGVPDEAEEFDTHTAQDLPDDHVAKARHLLWKAEPTRVEE